MKHRLLAIVSTLILSMTSAAPSYAGLMFFRGSTTATANGVIYFGANSTATETFTQFLLPAGNAKIVAMYVNCATAISTGTQTFVTRIAGGNGGLTCDMTGSATTCCANTDGSNGCTSGTMDSVTGGTTLVNAKSTASAGGSTASTCNITFDVRKADGTTPYDNILLGANMTTNGITDGYFCTMEANRGAGCDQASNTTAIFMMPAQSVTGIAVRRSSALTGADTETFTVVNVTAGQDTDVATTLDSSHQTNTTSACSSNCSGSDGNQWVVRSNKSGTGGNVARTWTVTFSGSPTMLTNAAHNTATGYSSAFNGQLTVGIDYMMPWNGTITKLFAYNNNTATSTITACSGAVPSACTGGGSTRPQCALSGTPCSDTSHPVDFTVGQGVRIQQTTFAETGNSSQVSIELQETAATATATPTSATTATPTETPTPTPTPTPPCAAETPLGEACTGPNGAGTCCRDVGGIPVCQ